MKKVNGKFKRDSSNAVGRWAAVGPYYAMFPLEFAFDTVNEYSKEGQLVLDPFAGRASSVYAAATQDRIGLGIEINPVGWVYAQAKLNPAPQQDVEDRFKSLISISDKSSQQPEEFVDFFQMCYSEKVLNFLLTVREHLDWKKNQIDCTLMAFLLIYLHGKLGEGLSNQMRQAKAMWPSYSIQWWQEQELTDPPEIPLKEFLLKRIKWRYSKGTPEVTKHSKVELGDSTQILQDCVDLVNYGKQKRCSLLFTSPPYQGVTNYHVDQWIRLWLLKESFKPEDSEKKHRGKFTSKESYRELLESVFKKVSKIMSEDGTIYVRTSAREFTFNTTLEILQKYFPSWKESVKNKPFPQKTQTHLFGDSRKKPGEMDIILTTK